MTSKTSKTSNANNECCVRYASGRHCHAPQVNDSGWCDKHARVMGTYDNQTNAAILGQHRFDAKSDSR